MGNLIFILLFIFNVQAEEAETDVREPGCYEAKVSWALPTTRVNGETLAPEELDFFILKVKDMESGQENEYILDHFNVHSAAGVVTERVYTNNEGRSFKLFTGLQCFAIAVQDKATEKKEAMRSVFSDWVCKDICPANGFDVIIDIGVKKKRQD